MPSSTYSTNSVTCSFNINVLIWPAIVSPPQSTNVAAGRSFTLSVAATGSVPISYSWSFEGGIIAGATSSTLTITNAQAVDEGIYRVVVANGAGSVTSG